MTANKRINKIMSYDEVNYHLLSLRMNLKLDVVNYDFIHFCLNYTYKL